MHRSISRLSVSTALLLGTLVASSPALAWCSAMGGYASYEAQARAEARRQRQAERTGQIAQRRALVAQTRGDQQALARLGYYRGAVDGQRGPATIRAIAVFRSNNDLPPGDALDDGSRQRLNECLAAKARPDQTAQGSASQCCTPGGAACPQTVARK